MNVGQPEKGHVHSVTDQTVNMLYNVFAGPYVLFLGDYPDQDWKGLFLESQFLLKGLLLLCLTDKTQSFQLWLTGFLKEAPSNSVKV